MDAWEIACVVVIAVLSITCHEAAHAFAADRLGDSTPRNQGRLTLNPIPHIDPFFTILLPAVLVLSGSGFIFGGAKPVQVNIARLRSPRRDWALVGAAGPASNVLIAIVLTAILAFGVHLGLAHPESSLATVLTVGIFLNVLLAVFNLIPIPPLDGSRVVQYFLSDDALAVYRRLEQYGLLIIVALLLFVAPFRILLAGLVFLAVKMVTLPFGMWTDVASILQRLLFG